MFCVRLWRWHNSISWEEKGGVWLVAAGALLAMRELIVFPLMFLGAVLALDVARLCLLAPVWVVQSATAAAREARKEGERARAEQQRRCEAAEQDRKAREAAAARALADREVSAARRRREDALAACELLYALHAPDIGDRLPREVLDRFAARFLAADRPPEEVERKAAELQQLIRQHAERAAGGRAETLADVQAWYAEQLRQLGPVPAGPVKQSLQAVLLREYNDRMLRAMGTQA